MPCGSLDQPDFVMDKTGRVVCVAASCIFSPPFLLLRKFRVNVSRSRFGDENGLIWETS